MFIELRSAKVSCDLFVAFTVHWLFFSLRLPVSPAHLPPSPLRFPFSPIPLQTPFTYLSLQCHSPLASHTTSHLAVTMPDLTDWVCRIKCHHRQSRHHHLPKRHVSHPLPSRSVSSIPHHPQTLVITLPGVSRPDIHYHPFVCLDPSSFIPRTAKSHQRAKWARSGFSYKHPHYPLAQPSNACSEWNCSDRIRQSSFDVSKRRRRGRISMVWRVKLDARHAPDRAFGTDSSPVSGM